MLMQMVLVGVAEAVLAIARAVLAALVLDDLINDNNNENEIITPIIPIPTHLLILILIKLLLVVVLVVRKITTA